MGLRHAEVRLVRAPKTNVWNEITNLKEDPVVGPAKVRGSGKGATRTFEKGRKEKVVDLKENRKIVFEIEDGKANGQLEIELEEHELGTMIIHRATLDGGKGRHKKELKKRLDAIQQAVE